MSMPTFPQIDPPLTREGSLNEIIASIAAEELSLSHILNAEGEKLQYVLGTLPGLGAAAALTEVMQINQSVQDTMSKSLFKISGCAGWAGIFSSSKEKSAGILDVFRAFLTPQDGKRPVQTVCQEILNRL